MKNKLITVLLFLFGVNIFCQEIISTSKIIYEDEDFIYDDLYLTSMESGISLLSYKKPISISEIILSYEQIDSGKLSKQGSEAYDRIHNSFYNKTLAFSEKQFGLDYNCIFALEGRYLFNEKKEPFIDKIYRYNKSQEPFRLPLELYLSKYVFSYFVPYLGKNFGAFNLSYPYTNVPLEQKALDYHFPKKVGIAIGNNFFNIHIGRGRINVGKTLSGSMLISDSIDRMNYMTAAIFFKHFKVDLTIAELNPTSFFISHEFSIRPVKQISFTIHEGIKLDSVFDPKFLNPFMIFHSYAPWKQLYIKHENDANSIGCQLGLDINIVPIKNLRIYGQMGMNQFQTPSEIKSGATDTPNSMGGLVGIEYIIPVFQGHLILTSEFMYADPWLYIGRGGNSNSFITNRKEIVYATKSYNDSQINYWLANPYGADTMTFFFKSYFIKNNKYNLSLTYRFLVQGENADKYFKNIKNNQQYYPESEPSKKRRLQMTKYKTPSGNASYFHTINLEGKYNILRGLNLSAGFSWTVVTGKVKGHSIDFNTTISYAVR